MKKLLYIIIGIFIGGIIFAQTNAISNWTQTVWKNNIYGIFSPSKNSLEAIPNISIHPDSRLGVGLTNENSITDSSFRSGDVIAKRYCFEDSKECVSTFQSSVTGNYKFNIIASSEFVKEHNGTSLVPMSAAAKKRGDPFYVVINSDFLKKVGLDPNYGVGEFRGQQATNWFEIGKAYVKIHRTDLASIYLSNGANFSPTVTRTYAGYFVSKGREKLVFCRDNITTYTNLDYCSNPNNNIIETSVCDSSTNRCGALRAEFRITTHDNDCINNPYLPTLSTSGWGDPEITNLYHTPYSSSPTNPNYTPDKCDAKKYGLFHMVLKMRIVLDRFSPAPYDIQSLPLHIGNGTRTIKIRDMGISLLN